MNDLAAVRTGCAGSGSRRRPGRTPTREPGSRCSAVPGCPVTRRRRSPTPPWCTGSPASPLRWRCTIPWDRVDDYAALAQSTPPTPGWRSGDQLQRVPGRRLQAGLGDHPDPGCAARPPTTCWIASTSWTDRLPGSQAVVRRRHQLPGQDSIRARQTGWPRRLHEVYERLGAHQRMLLEYKLSSRRSTHRRAGLGHRVCTAWSWGPRAGCASTPATTLPAPTSSCIVAFLAARRPAGRVRLQLPVLRRRRLMVAPPTRSSCSGSCTRSSSAGHWPRRPASRSCWTQCHNIEGKIPAIIRSGAQLAGGHAKALLVERRRAWRRGSFAGRAGANAVLMDAFATTCARCCVSCARAGPGPRPVAPTHRSG